ncbi:chemotaxis protein CheB [Dankookia sp. GCM10030260]|uniref:chemotaxis protein CheB n=1 Tax=Dankookia sp. GCM10030260 TaxID=3273390 RepID=UPI0036121284
MRKGGDRPTAVVIGASAGGVEALQALVAQLPHEFGAALLVVLHIGIRRSALPGILARAGQLPAAWAADGEPIRPGRIYVAPPDRHLLIAPDGLSLLLSRGPAENRTRPAADPLFRSAARAFGPRVVGVVLSGALADGTAGLAEIVRHGGITAVQEPNEAEYPDMPRSALRHVSVRHRLPVTGIADLLIRLCGPAHFVVPENLRSMSAAPAPQREENTPMEGEHTLKRPITLTCPSCGGAVAQSSVDSLPYFECHTGHRFAAPDMGEAQFVQMDQALEVALRALNERAELCRRLAEAARGRGQVLSAGRWDAAVSEAEQRARVMRKFIEQGWERPVDDEDEGGLAGTPSVG